jgi:isoquinoline 1-oxidoreductase
LEEHARGGVPENPYAAEIAASDKSVKRTYHVPYIQHCPMECRAAVAQWNGDKLTVWTSSQNPFGVRGEVAGAFRIAQPENVQIVVPDFGGGFGGKHTGETAIEAARLAKAAGKPVSLRWTRPEEFTWAYFRPAAVVKAEAHLDANGKIGSWYFVNINGDRSALDSPYNIAHKSVQQLASQPPLRHGSYRALGSTANNFARESLMDELADAAGTDPLEFRLAHLQNDRLRAVVEDAAKRFDWTHARASKQPNRGVGLACGTEKGSFVAACVEVEIEPKSGAISVRRVAQSFECGAIVNPENLRTQVMGAIIMGMGGALREEMKFENGQITNATFSKYLVPRFDDVPQLDINLLNRIDLPSAGAGETPIIAIAPAIANAVFHAAGKRVRQMPIKLETT